MPQLVKTVKHWSKATRQVVMCASREAITRGHRYIRPEHFLLALLKLKDTDSMMVLKEKEITPSELENVLVESLPQGKRVYPKPGVNVQIDIRMSKNAVRTLLIAYEEFVANKAGQLEPRHILLAILRLDHRSLKGVLKKAQMKTARGKVYRQGTKKGDRLL